MSEPKRLRALECENKKEKLKRLPADAALDPTALKDDW